MKNRGVFRKTLSDSLGSIADAAALEVESIAKAVSSQYCIGYHLRHVLDVETPSVRVRATSNAKAERILSENNKLGLHTLNHVIDSLLYMSHRRFDASFAIVDIQYSRGADGTHAFDVIEAPGYRDGIHIINMLCSWAAAWSPRRQCAFDTDIERFIHTQKWDSTEAKWSCPYDGFVCGTQKMCDALDIRNPNPLIYRSIISAVLQLAEYTESFGQFTRTYLLREFTPFGIGVGATVISATEISRDLDEKIHSVLENALRDAHGEVERHYRVLSQHNRGIYSTVAHQILPERPRDTPMPEAAVANGGNLNRGLSRTVHRKIQTQIAKFLEICTKFCEEELEGRTLHYGILLGHPTLLKFWPGSTPVPLHDVKIDELAKQVHLAEGPQERLIAIPYPSTVDNMEDCRRYAVDLSDFSEALESDRHATIWDSELRPYIYLTRRYPWALAAVVGPHSNVRVFSRGLLTHYRDGKGWKRCCLEEVKESITDKAGFPHQSAQEKLDYSVAVGLLLEFCLQLSPMARSSSHGALVLWVPECIDRTSVLMQRIRKKSFQLRQDEPKDVNGKKWLTGKALFRKDEPGCSYEFDLPVIRLAMRAAMVDGALILGGPNAVVLGFGLQLQFPGVLESAAGTKRSAASGSVSELSRESQGVISVAISSDGPIRVYHSNRRSRGSPVEEEHVFEDIGGSQGGLP
jgi:hypothetical protein